MRQRVKFQSYLAISEMELKDLEADKTFEAIALPAGAEVIMVNVEVLEAGSDTARVKVGLDDDDTFFITEASCQNEGTNHQSARITRTQKNSVVSLTNFDTQTSGKIVLRVEYYLPSEIIAEY